MIVLLWLIGFFALSAIVTAILTLFLGANGPDEEDPYENHGDGGWYDAA